MDLVLDQVVSLREQIKRRQQGLDNGKEVRAAGWGARSPPGGLAFSAGSSSACGGGVTPLLL